MRLLALRLLALLVLAAQFAAAQIPATDDAYTASSSASGNFGNQSMLNVIGPGVNSYIRFDLTALPASLTSANISKATVRLNINGVTTPVTFDVYLVTKSWTEASLTYNSAVTLGRNQDFNATISRHLKSPFPTAGQPAFGATFSPGPDGEFTGKGANWGDPLSHAFAGYVLLTW